MSKQSSQLIFLVSLIALYFYFNACRRLLVSTSPVLLSEKLISEEWYGFLSSATSILFGICRFLGYSLLDWFSVDWFVTLLTIGSCCICLFMSLFLKSVVRDSISVFLGGGFLLLFLFVGLSFPSSSVIIRSFFSGKGVFPPLSLICRTQLCLVFAIHEFLYWFHHCRNFVLLCERSLRSVLLHGSFWYQLCCVILCILPNGEDLCGREEAICLFLFTLQETGVCLFSPVFPRLLSRFLFVLC